MASVDDFLDRITMYRLVLYYLLLLLTASLVLSSFHLLPFRPIDLVFSTLLILISCWLTNFAFARAFGAIPNVESVFITALILALLISPVSLTSFKGIDFAILASVLAMGSKYLIAIGKKHLFNPAAFGIALGALMSGTAASWWVGGNWPLAAFVILGGLLIVRKTRRYDLVIAFAIAAGITIILTSRGSSPLTALAQTAAHTPFFFFAFVMLTEPLTMPPSRWSRVAYGAIVGFLFAPATHIGSLYFAPELALLIGNAFAYAVSPKGRFMLTLAEKREVATNTYEFVFTPDRPVSFSPGQYAEWTLATRANDSRGNRRYFTMASSPTEKQVRIGARIQEPASVFKKELISLPLGTAVTVSSIAGDFIMPKDETKKLAFLAGGIGITPFRSMTQHLIDTDSERDIVMLYANKTREDIAYSDLFSRAEEQFGMKTVYSLTDEPVPLEGNYCGPVDAELIQREIPDHAERIFYISGPHGMVVAIRRALTSLGVSRLRIRTDYFPGYA